MLAPARLSSTRLRWRSIKRAAVDVFDQRNERMPNPKTGAEMKITIERMTTDDAMHRAFSATCDMRVVIDKAKALRSEHSPIRCLWYWIEFEQIPQRVVNHLTRHKHGVEWFVETSRPDRAKEPTALRDMACMINAQALINISRTRLCNKAWHETLEVWEKVKAVMWYEDPLMSEAMVPNCVYRGSCTEINPCHNENKTTKE